VEEQGRTQESSFNSLALWMEGQGKTIMHELPNKSHSLTINIRAEC